MAKNTKDVKKANKYVSTVGVKKGRKTENIEEGIFNLDEEIIIGVNNKKKGDINKKVQKNKKNQTNRTTVNKKNKNATNSKNVSTGNKNASANKKNVTNSKNNVNASKKKNEKVVNKKEKRKQTTKKATQPIQKIKTQEEIEREQKAKKKRLKLFKRIKIFILIVAILTAIILFLLSPVFNIKQIVVTGNSKITEEQIISLSGITLDENSFKINTVKVQKQIKENAYIKSAKVTRVLPSQINIEVEERVATFMIEYGGSYVYINNQGYILELSTQIIEAPILVGIVTSDNELQPGNRLNTEDLEKLSTVLKIVESANSNGIATQIEKIDISDEDDYKIIFKTAPRIAHIGDATSIGIRMLNVKALLEDNIGIEGEIFANMDLNVDNPYFRTQV